MSPLIVVGFFCPGRAERVLIVVGTGVHDGGEGGVADRVVVGVAGATLAEIVGVEGAALTEVGDVANFVVAVGVVAVTGTLTGISVPVIVCHAPVGD